MTLANILAGLAILKLHYKNLDDYHMAAEHDQIYLMPTDAQLTHESYNELIDLGWFQLDDDEQLDQYDAQAGWSCYV